MGNFVEIFSVPSEPDPKRPDEFRRPEWAGPPESELGVTVPLGAILGRAGNGVIALPHVLAYSTGISFELLVFARGLRAGQVNRLFHEQHLIDQEEGLPDGFLRVGIELEGGARVSNLDGGLAGRRWDEEPSGPILMQHGGGSGMSNPGEVTMRPAFWLWPLPPSGALKVSCEWPIVGIPLTTTELDADALREAAGRARPLF